MANAMNLGRVQGAGIYYTSQDDCSSVTTRIPKDTVATIDLTVLVGDKLLDPNGNLFNIESLSSTSGDDYYEVKWLAKLESAGTAVILNGAATEQASFYAPIAAGDYGQILSSGGTGNTPAWHTAPITGLNGETIGATNNGKAIYAPTGAGNAGQILQSNGDGEIPTWINNSSETHLYQHNITLRSKDSDSNGLSAYFIIYSDYSSAYTATALNSRYLALYFPSGSDQWQPVSGAELSIEDENSLMLILGVQQGLTVDGVALQVVSLVDGGAITSGSRYTTYMSLASTSAINYSDDVVQIF